MLTVVVLSPDVTMAQGDAYARIFFSTTQVYNDNLFAAASGDRQGDLIFTFSPEVEAGYRSAPFTVIGRYTFDADRYAEHVALSKTIARQAASMELRYSPTPRLALSVNPSYVQTQWPSEFNLNSRLVVSRAYAERLAAASAVSYEWDPRTRLNLDYGFVKDALAGGIAVENQGARIGFDRRAGDRNIYRVDYRFNYFGFGNQGAEVSHVVSVGWTREITRLTSLDIGLGPRLLVRPGVFRPEFSVSLRHRLQKGALGLSYARSETTTIGYAGILNVQSITLPVSYQPTRRLTLSGTPVFVNAAHSGSRFTIYALNLDAVVRAARRLSLVASARIGVQQTSQAGRRDEIQNRSLSLKLVSLLPGFSPIQP